MQKAMKPLLSRFRRLLQCCAVTPDSRSFAQLAAESSRGKGKARGRGAARRGGKSRGGPKKVAPACPRSVKKRILKQRDLPDDFLSGQSSQPSATLVDDEVAADEAKI